VDAWRQRESATSDSVARRVYQARLPPHCISVYSHSSAGSFTLDHLRRTKRDPAAMHAEARQYAAMCSGAVLVEDTVQFGPLRLDAAQVFYASPPNLTLATVNLKPLLPGHVLVFPRRPVQHLSELTDDETLDLWQSVQKIYVLVLAAHGADSAQIGVQDGKHAGQSVS
jgi:diadenosine tetraphosphate (Ap4A) HIT family hydrolase